MLRFAKYRECTRFYFVHVKCADVVITFLRLEVKSIKADETSPQHPSVKKDRDSVEINDYEEEGDLEEEEVCNGQRKWGLKKIYPDVIFLC